MTPAEKRPRLSLPLVCRIDAIDGCRGRWILDLRDSDNRGHDLYLIPGYVYGVGTFNTALEAAVHCASQHWRDARLLWCSDWLDDDSRWPGGYDAPSIIRSNARVFRDEFAKELELADGDADGLSLDVRYVTDEMLETLQALESYPLISEDDHSELELELQGEAWESWAAADWRREVEKRLQELAPDNADAYWADEILDSIPDIDSKLAALFEVCREAANKYWEEQDDGCCSSGFWLDVAKVAEQIDTADLADLTGLPLLAPDQQWRRDPYPWQGAESAPLVEG